MSMTGDELQKKIEALTARGWILSKDNNQLMREFNLKDFAAAFSLMSQVAEKAESLNHHPNWSNNYNHLRIRLTTHSVGALTSKDIELAEHIEELHKSSRHDG